MFSHLSLLILLVLATVAIAATSHGVEYMNVAVKMDGEKANDIQESTNNVATKERRKGRSRDTTAEPI